MSQVFLSYARPNWDVARRVAATLREQGYEVWLDDELPAHRAYDEVIQERLHAASAVVVLWSEAAAKSQWVRAEADAARQAGKLVQARLEDILPPIPFNLIQSIDLAGWNGDADAEPWRKVEASVRTLVGSNPAATAAPPRSAKLRETSICVLPFENMSGDQEQEYFSDGISEDITTDLSKVSALAVTARNSAFAFKGKAVDICDVAGKLGVSHVLEGSVRKAGNRVRITAQLIDGASGDHLWAERYDRELTDIFAIQDEISEAIVSALKLKLLPEEKAAIEQRGTTSADAYNLYLMARNYWVTGNHGDRSREQRVIRLCERAVEIDAHYARAWALLSIVQSNLHFGFGEPCDDGLEAAQRALSLDPGIAEAYCVLARDLSEQGRYEEALEQLGTGLNLDPESWELHKAAGNLLYAQRRIAEAKEHFEKAAAIMKTDFHAWGMLHSCCQTLGDTRCSREAARRTLEEAERVLAEDPSNGAAISFAVTGLAALGERERAKEWMQRALLIDPDNLNMRYNFACTLAANFGDREAALEMVGPTITGIKGSLGNVELDPDLDLIRDDPQFQAWIAEARTRLNKNRE